MAERGGEQAQGDAHGDAAPRDGRPLDHEAAAPRKRARADAPAPSAPFADEAAALMLVAERPFDAGAALAIGAARGLGAGAGGADKVALRRIIRAADDVQRVNGMQLVRLRAALVGAFGGARADGRSAAFAAAEHALSLAAGAREAARVRAGSVWTLAQVDAGLDALAAVRGDCADARRAARVAELFAGGSADEAYWLVRAVLKESPAGAAFRALDAALGGGGGARDGWLRRTCQPRGVCAPLAAWHHVCRSPGFDGWVQIEQKHDGWRAQLELGGAAGLRLVSRGGHEPPCFAEREADLRAALPPDLRCAAAGPTILDGEAVATRGEAARPCARVRERGPFERLRFYAFDVLALRGACQLARPLRERRAALEAVCARAEPGHACLAHVEAVRAR